MLIINNVVGARELVELAREIQAAEGLTLAQALRYAASAMPELVEDVEQDARYRPARVVWFGPEGQAQRAPDLSGGHYDR